MIAVVGATLSGLVAAASLDRRGYDVRVFEAADGAGGLAGTTPTAGEPIETVPVSVARPRDDRAIEALGELGLEECLEWRATRSGCYVDGTVHPQDTPWEFVALPHLSFGDTARLAALTSGVDVRGVPRSVPKRGAYDDHRPFAGIPAKQFVREHASNRVYDRFVEPVLVARFGSHAPDVSAAWLLDHLRAERETTRAGREIRGSLEGGTAELAEALIDAIGPDRIETNARVTDVATGDDGASATVESISIDRDGHPDTESLAVDAVVIATGPDELKTLTGNQCSLPIVRRTCVRVATETPLTDVYRVTMGDAAPFDELRTHTAFVPADRYGGHHQYYLLDGGQTASDDRPAERVERRWLEGLAACFAAFDRNDLVGVETTRFSQPVYEAGYRSRFVPTDLSEDVADGVYYAGVASRPQYPIRRLGGTIGAGVTCADLATERDRGRESRERLRH